jgi:hypothetical protein
LKELREQSSRPEGTSIVSVLVAAAEANRSYLTADDITGLASLYSSAQEMERAFSEDPLLRGRFVLKSGVVSRRDAAKEAITEASLETHIRRLRSVGYILAAKAFASRLTGREARMMSVSGSVSYFSAKRDDDIDFFCVTRPDALWLFLARATLLKMANKLLHPETPELCFSCLMDEGYALRAFEGGRDALFARDALTAVVLNGSGYYRELLEGSAWMKAYFPVLYRSRTQGINPERPSPGSGPSAGDRVLNLFLFAVAGSVIRLKSYLLNRRFLKENRPSRVFVARMGAGHLLYESRRYSGLRSIYSQLGSAEGEAGPRA